MRAHALTLPAPPSSPTHPPRALQGVSFADVADICRRALHEPEARNKTFDVAYEYTPAEGLQMYELGASIPQVKGANYLKPALATLQKNT